MNGTVDNETMVLSAMFHAALAEKKIDPYWMPGKFLRLDERNQRPAITDDQIQRLLDKARPAMRDIILCGYESAMRASEITDLRARQVHLDVPHDLGRTLDYIDLGVFDTKTGARRQVPVSEALKDLLQRRLVGLEPDDHVFTNGQGKPYGGKHPDRGSQAVSMNFANICKRANIPHGDKLLNDKGERVGIVFHCTRVTRIFK